MEYKQFPISADNCKACLEVSDANLKRDGMIPACIDVDTSKTVFSKNLHITLKPKLETMLFDTKDNQGDETSDIYAYITGDGRELVISPISKHAKYQEIIINCKVNN